PSAAAPHTPPQRVTPTRKSPLWPPGAGGPSPGAPPRARAPAPTRRCRDFTLNSLTFALREVIACLPVYRTYLTGPGGVVAQDRRVVEKAVAEAKRHNPRTAEAVFDFVGDAVLLRGVEDFPEADRPPLVEWALQFPQLT